MNNNTTRVVTGKARLSFVHLFTPYAHQPGQEPKYSTTILVPKSDVATKQRIDAAVQQAIAEGTTSKWNNVRPPQLAVCVHDGDGVRPSDGMPFGDECKGHWVFTASSKQPPQVVDASLNPVINQSEIYSGVYGRVSINFFPYTNSGKKGIGCGLGNVQKVEDGEPLSGRTNAADDFGGAPAYPQQAPAYPQYATQPAYVPQQPQYTPQQPPVYPNPQHPTAQPQYAPQPQQQQQPQIDPITGQPVVGGVYGL